MTGIRRLFLPHVGMRGSVRHLFEEFQNSLWDRRENYQDVPQQRRAPGGHPPSLRDSVRILLSVPSTACWAKIFGVPMGLFRESTTLQEQSASSLRDSVRVCGTVPSTACWAKFSGVPTGLCKGKKAGAVRPPTLEHAGASSVRAPHALEFAYSSRFKDDFRRTWLDNRKKDYGGWSPGG